MEHGLVEKACIESYSAPQNFQQFSLPHDCYFEIPVQSREVAKQINVFEKQPVFQYMKLSASLTLPVFEAGNFNFNDLQKDPLEGVSEDKTEFLNQLKVYLKIARERFAQDPAFAETVNTPVDRESFLAYKDAVNLAECVAQDPHPYFAESYVWLPVGGSIKHLSLGNKTFIFAPDGDQFDQIRAIPVDESDGWQQCGPITRVDCYPGERILQVVTSKHKKKGYVGVRRLRGFHVVQFKRADNSNCLKSRELINVSDPTDALVALDISTLNGELASTIDKSNKIKIYDIAAGKCLVDHQIVDEESCGGLKNKNTLDAKFIQFSKQPSMLYVINRRKLYLRDVRVPFTSPGTTFNVYDLSNGCEALSACEESRISDILYCCSSHHTFSLDPRKGWVQRWNHGLNNMPLYLNAGVTEPTKELVVTASIEMGSATGVLNSWENTNDGLRQSCCSFPTTMPSIRDTCIWANSNGHWLEPSIAKRVESSLCGMTLVPNRTSPGCSLFSLNAVGDVFCTSFRPDEDARSDSFFPHASPEANGTGLERVKQWEEDHANLTKQNRIDVQCETLTDRSYLLSVMKQHPNKDALMRGRVGKWKKAIAKGRGVWRARPTVDKDKPMRQSKLEKLGTFKDWMAREILPLWDMDSLMEQARLGGPKEFSTVSIESDDSE